MSLFPLPSPSTEKKPHNNLQQAGELSPLTFSIHKLLTRIPDAGMKLSVHELVLSCLPDVLDHIAGIGAGAVEADAVGPTPQFTTERFGDFPGPFAPVTAAEGCDGEDQ